MKDNNLLIGCTIQEAIQEIENGILAYYATDTEGNMVYETQAMLPYYLMGPPGIGKTEIVSQIAQRLGIGFISYSITHYTRSSILGLPVIRDLEGGEEKIFTDHSGKYTETTMSEIVAGPVRACSKGQERGILLLDEFNCISETLLPVALSLLQTRTIGTYTLPKGWILVLCGNPSAYNSSARPLTPALLDRVRMIVIDADADSFLDYADQKGLHPLLISYLRGEKNSLYKIQGTGEAIEVVTYRGWENLSRAMFAYELMELELTENTVRQFIKSQCIAESFYNFYKVNREGFSYIEAEAVMKGERIKELQDLLLKRDYSFRMKAVTFLENALVQHCGRVLGDDSSEQSMTGISQSINNVFRFVKMLPEGSAMAEHLMYKVTDDEGLLSVVENIPTEEYIEVSRNAYGLTRKGA